MELEINLGSTLPINSYVCLLNIGLLIMIKAFSSLFLALYGQIAN